MPIPLPPQRGPPSSVPDVARVRNPFRAALHPCDIGRTPRPRQAVQP